MHMKNPPHPGLSVRHDCLEPLGLAVAEGAKVLDVTRQALNNLVNWQGRDFRRDGDPSGQGLWGRRRSVVADAGGL
jgi:hypothetical protein